MISGPFISSPDISIDLKSKTQNTKIKDHRSNRQKERDNTYESISKTQYPNVPNETTECTFSDPFVNLTFRSPISLITGAEMVVMRRRIEDAKRKNVPMWWMKPVAILRIED